MKIFGRTALYEVGHRNQRLLLRSHAKENTSCFLLLSSLRRTSFALQKDGSRATKIKVKRHDLTVWRFTLVLEVGLEPTKPYGRRFTVFRDCHYTIPARRNSLSRPRFTVNSKSFVSSLFLLSKYQTEQVLGLIFCIGLQLYHGAASRIRTEDPHFTKVVL